MCEDIFTESIFCSAGKTNRVRVTRKNVATYTTQCAVSLQHNLPRQVREPQSAVIIICLRHVPDTACGFRLLFWREVESSLVVTSLSSHLAVHLVERMQQVHQHDVGRTFYCSNVDGIKIE